MLSRLLYLTRSLTYVLSLSFSFVTIMLPILYKLHYFWQVFVLFLYKHSDRDNSRNSSRSFDLDDDMNSLSRVESYNNSSTYERHESFSNSNSWNDDFSRRQTDPSYSYLSYNIHHNTHYGNY